MLLALFADQRPPAWVLEALDELPALMGQAKQRESAMERAMLDMAEALVLEHSVGETFEAFVVAIDTKRDRATIQIAEPAIVTRIPVQKLKLAESVTLRVDSVDVDKRRVDFAVVADK
jgi:exoribonuclease R